MRNRDGGGLRRTGFKNSKLDYSQLDDRRPKPKSGVTRPSGAGARLRKQQALNSERAVSFETSRRWTSAGIRDVGENPNPYRSGKTRKYN